MFGRHEKPVQAPYFLKPGYILLPKRPTVISVVLGSCVSVCLYDRKRESSGINHYEYPVREKNGPSTARYGNVATLTLAKMMIDEGSKEKHLEAQIFGGAYNPEISSKDIGKENIKVARMILEKKGIKIVSVDVGGEKGRKIVFDTGSNEIAVIRVDRLRRGDWFPYQDDR